MSSTEQRAYGAHLVSMRDGRCQQRYQSNGDHHKCEVARRKKTAPNGTIFLDLKLEKFVDGKAEADHRGGGADPSHQRALMGKPRAVQGQLVAVWHFRWS